MSRSSRITTLWIGQLFYILLLISLSFAKEYVWLLWVAAVFNGLKAIIFWLPYYELTSRYTFKKRLGEDLGLMNFLVQLAQLIAPAMGGLLAAYWGFSALFVISISIIAVCLTLTMLIKITPLTAANFSHFKHPNKELGKLMKMPWFRRQAWSFAGKYAYDSVLALWPIYIFILLGTVDRVGWLYSLSFFIAMFASLMVGIYIDHAKRQRSFLLSGGLMSALWIARSFIASIWGITILDSVERLIGSFHWLWYEVMLYATGKKQTTTLLYYAGREMIIDIAGIIWWSGVVGVFLFVENAWLAMFLLAAVGVMLSTFINQDIDD